MEGQGNGKRMRKVVGGILKDKASMIKACATGNAFQVAILGATTHCHPTEAPPDHTLHHILNLTHLHHHHHPNAFSMVETLLLRRLHSTHSASVALKCLLTLHHILARNSNNSNSNNKHQISNTQYPLLNLAATFQDSSDSHTRELSRWVRWYAQLLHHILLVSPSLGLSFYPFSTNTETMSGASTTSVLIMELSSLVGVIEHICRAPESLHYQRMGLLYEVIKLVGEDHRVTLREIFARISEISERRIQSLSDDEVKELGTDLKTLEDCKDKLLLMFLNKKRNDGVWDVIAHMRNQLEMLLKQRTHSHSWKLLQRPHKLNESTSLAIQHTKQWLNVPWNPFVASAFPNLQ